MRKNILATLIICICALALVDFSRAADPSIYIAWTYENPPTDLAGYHLYVNDVQVQDFDVPTAVSWSGPVVLVNGENTFEISPYDDSGQEGSRGDPYVKAFDAPPTGIVVITNVTIN